MTQTHILSYGGGRQTVAMCLLVMQGKLPRPDRIVMADTGREARTTFDYLNQYVAPHLAEHDLRVEIAGHDLATVDLYAGNGDLLLPVFTETGKLRTYCSNEWKARVVQRYLRQSGVTRAVQWIGFSLDEKERAKTSERQTWPRVFPLIDLMLTRADCEAIITRQRWPLPPKSRCYMCPHQSNEEWRQIKADAPDQFAEAVAIDEDIRLLDAVDGVFLHHSRRPLALVDLDAQDRRADLGQQCGLGTCWV